MEQDKQYTFYRRRLVVKNTNAFLMFLLLGIGEPCHNKCNRITNEIPRISQLWSGEKYCEKIRVLCLWKPGHVK